MADPAGCLELSLKNRLSLARGLMKAGYVEAARQFITAAFADNPARKSVLDLNTRLDKAVSVRVEVVLSDSRQALDANQVERAVDLVEQALALRPNDLSAHLLRGEARMRSGRDLAALNDFRVVIAAASDTSLVEKARVAAAQTLEARQDTDGVLTFLEGLDSEATGRIRGRLERQHVGNHLSSFRPCGIR